MIAYTSLISANIPGNTPRAQYEYLEGMKSILRSIAYPRRGSIEEEMDINAFAAAIQHLFSAEDLAVKKVV
jgi:hypothetical protein